MWGRSPASVDTYENIVYLTGGVTSSEMKHRAETIARGVSGVEQVVNNLHLAGKGVLAAAGPEVSASPVMEGLKRPAAPQTGAHPILQLFPGLARVELETETPGWTRYSVYDAGGRRVATVYSVSAGELARNGAAAELTADEGINREDVARLE